MSELTPCNYCELTRIRRRAQRAGQAIKLEVGEHGWTDVLVDGVRVASMMKVTEWCCC